MQTSYCVRHRCQLPAEPRPPVLVLLASAAPVPAACSACDRDSILASRPFCRLRPPLELVPSISRGDTFAALVSGLGAASTAATGGHNYFLISERVVCSRSPSIAPSSLSLAVANAFRRPIAPHPARFAPPRPPDPRRHQDAERPAPSHRRAQRSVPFAPRKPLPHDPQPLLLRRSD